MGKAITWLSGNCRFAQKFSYRRQVGDLWREVVRGGKEVFDVSFDTENDEAVADPFTVKIDDNRFVCQPYYAAGDWEASVLYYRCQYQDRGNGYKFESFGEKIDTCDNSFFIFIPDKEDGNPNLVEKDGGGWSAADADDRVDPSDRKGRKALKRWLQDNLEKE